MDRVFAALGAVSAFVAVAAFETGARYQMYHARALLLVVGVRALGPWRS